MLTTFLWDPTFRTLHQTGTVAVVLANDKSFELQRLQDYRGYGLGLKAVPWVLRTRVRAGLSRGPHQVPGCHVCGTLVDGPWANARWVHHRPLTPRPIEVMAS